MILPLGLSLPASLPITDPVLIVAIAAVIFLVAPLMVQMLRLPGLIGLILAGAIIGPNALNLLARSNTIVLLGTVGLLYLMFMAGIEIDLHEFKRYRNRSIVFGAFTFLLPQGIGTGVMLGLDYDLPTAILIGSMFASHTLLAYPIAMRFGIGKNQAVTTTVGGTIITDTAALLVLAVVAASTRGTLDAAFWIRLAVGLGAYLVVMWLALPRLARWFFRSERTGAIAEYVFVFAALFVGSFLAEVAGVEAIVGAFLAGLALNRLIPEQSVLANRIHFVGEAIFIPFFLLSVGMLMDVRVLAGDLRAWEVMIAMTVTVVATKWMAAWLSGRVFGYSQSEWWSMFGLSVPQAAATLAAALIGVEVGLLDDAVLNGTIMMILVTCILGPWVVDRYGRRLALEEERRPPEPGAAAQRILVPMANPATAPVLMDLALAFREPDSREAIYPITVVPEQEEGSLINVALAERMLSHAVTHAAAVDVPVTPVTRVDDNFANGIRRAALETRTSMIIIGWDGRRSARQAIFGTVLDHLLEVTRQHVVVARVGHPLNTTGRVVLIVPRGSDRIVGFFEALRALKRMTSRLGAELRVYLVGAAVEVYQRHLDTVRPDAPATVERLAGWEVVRERLQKEVRADDLVVLLSARRGAVAWHPELGRLPSTLATLARASFLVLYPSEIDLSLADSGTNRLPAAFSPEHILVGLPRSSYRQALSSILEVAFPGDPERVQDLTARLVQSEEEFTTELKPGMVVPHLRVPELSRSMIMLGVSPDGVDFPHAEAPAHLIFVLLTPVEPPQEQLHRLAEIARLVSDSSRTRALRETRTAGEALEILRDVRA